MDCARAESVTQYAVVERCRGLVESRRRGDPKKPDEAFSELDISTLLKFDDSWDDPGSDLRLAPEATFLIGSGILWDLVNPDEVKVPSQIVGRDSSFPKGIHILRTYSHR
jgi:hypothetical protein